MKELFPSNVRAPPLNHSAITYCLLHKFSHPPLYPLPLREGDGGGVFFLISAPLSYYHEQCADYAQIREDISIFCVKRQRPVGFYSRYQIGPAENICFTEDSAATIDKTRYPGVCRPYHRFS